MGEVLKRLRSIHTASYLAFGVCTLIVMDSEPSGGFLWAFLIGAVLTLWAHIVGAVIGGVLFVVFLSYVNDSFPVFFEDHLEWVAPLVGVSVLLAYHFK